MKNQIELNIDHHIAEVVLNRPEKMNALDQNAFEQLVSAAETIKQNNAVRVVIIRAEGEHFCAGADKAFLQGAVSNNDEFKCRALTLPAGEIANEFQKPVLCWRELNVPVIACLQGVVYGAGMQLALAADIRIGSLSTAMSLFEIHWGLIPDMGVTQTLTRLVRADVATELVVTGRVVKAEEAEKLGLITHVNSDSLSFARSLAQDISSKSPDATSRGKQLIRDSFQMTTDDALKLEAQFQSELVGKANQVEAAMANVEKRKAKFK